MPQARLEKAIEALPIFFFLRRLKKGSAVEKDKTEKTKPSASGEMIVRRVEDLVCFSDYPVAPVLNTLLKDKSTGRNIIWATSSYLVENGGFAPAKEIDRFNVTGFFRTLIQPRVCRTTIEQSHRTRTKAEVFTPGWVCAKMNGMVDEALKDLSWREYVRARCLEITCGEAPFLVSRYDAVTGEIIPIEKRFGLLDRKLQKVGENTTTEKEWLLWARRAFESTYGYEYQGDNLLIARVNLLNTFCDHLKYRWGRLATIKEIQKIATIIAWNVWQMDGLSGRLPDPLNKFSALRNKKEEQLEFFEKGSPEEGVCKIYDWQSRRSVSFNDIKKETAKMKFSFVIGNPPYQEETKDTSDKPVYDKFMDAAFTISDKVELITPARFLFDAGKTPKEWNRKMLSDEHFKILHYEQDSAKVFANKDITGGVCVSYRDSTQKFGAIGAFTHFQELNSIVAKVVHQKDFSSLSGIIYQQNKFDLPRLYKDFPKYKSVIGSDGREKRLTTKIFEQLPLFSEERKREDDLEIHGLIKNRRTSRFIAGIYILKSENLDAFKVIVPKSNGSGAIGDVECTPLIGEPLLLEPLKGYTQSFIGIGAFTKKYLAEAALKYLKSKFARTLLGTLKITQDNNTDTWRNVPLQDFTSKSDIDWTKSISEIDRQLYKKYALTAKEIAFIESHVKEMV